MSEKKARQEILKKKHAKIIDYKKVFGSPEGERVLMDLMDEHFMLRTTSDTDQIKQNENEGERKVILRLFKILKVSPQQMAKLIEEIEKDVGSTSTSSEHDGDSPARTRVQW